MDFFETHDLNDKVAIITDSSAGIGAAIALQFVKLGASITIHGQSKNKLEKIKELCQYESAKKEEPLVICGEISDENVRVQLIEETVKHFGKLDILVNNTGYFEGDLMSSGTTTDCLDRMLDVVLKVPFHLTKLAISHLVKTEGNIINTSSVPATDFVYTPEYVIAKAGVDRLTEVTAQELGPKKVRVNSIQPGFIMTDLLKPSTPKSGKTTNDPCNKEIEKMHALKRLSNIEEIVKMAGFLASDSASFITGAIIPVDGEWLDY